MTLLRAADASRALGDLSTRTAGRDLTRDERRLAARYRALVEAGARTSPFTTDATSVRHIQEGA
ncbi:MAG: hypothetical protein L6367_09055 [Cellulomonas sp.]|nr:hypothetical protein [Cellulomonas sp.]